MGYVTWLAMDLYVKEELREEFESRLKDMKAGNCEPRFAEFDELDMYEDGELFVENTMCRWGDAEPLYDFLKPYVKEGTITGWGEECWDYWRVRFDGKGEWKEQIPIFVDKDSELAAEYGD